VNLTHNHPGRLLTISASLLFLLSNEVLKWQFPIDAASEKLAIVVLGVRSVFGSAVPLLVRR
jgi:hypothetical protein